MCLSMLASIAHSFSSSLGISRLQVYDFSLTITTTITSRKKLFILLILAIKVSSSISFDTRSAFIQTHNKHSLNQHYRANNCRNNKIISSSRMIMTATSSSVSSTDVNPPANKDSSTDTTSSIDNGNWRVIPNEDENIQRIQSILQERSLWSEQQYKESLELYHRLMSCSDSYIEPGIKDALNCLNDAYRLYGPNSVICSFNGGKDAVVILHLVRAAHAHYYETLSGNDETQKLEPIRPRVLYFDHKDEFPEMLSFLQNTVDCYDLDMICFDKGIKFSDGLKMIVDNNRLDDRYPPYPMGFVLGTRDSDPNAGNQGQFAPSSSSFMPPFMRVNPILSWTYGSVWHFLRLFHLPYCILYDQGYTSLGTVKDTLPCPALAVPGATKTTNSSGNSLPKYWPAYMLRDWDQERAGRISKKKTKQKSASQKKGDNASSGKPSSSPTLPTTALSTNTTSSVNSDSVISAPSIATGFRGPCDPSSVTKADGDAANDMSVQNVVGDDVQSCVSYNSYLPEVPKTVGLLVIGDEILKGFTADTNTQCASKALREQNAILQRVAVVSDDQEAIVKEISSMSNDVDVIITSGGVGPTHDDVTIKSVAAALERDMILHKEMGQLLKDKMNKIDDNDKPLTEAQIKMATLPANSKLKYLSKDPNDWPVLQVRNIFILPGVPEFFEKKICDVADYLSATGGRNQRSITYEVILTIDETSIVSTLNTIVQKHPNVSFGSYPFVNHPEFKTVLTLEAKTFWGSNSQQYLNDSVISLWDKQGSAPAEEATEVETENTEEHPNGEDEDTATDLMYSKERMDEYVRLALDDLITMLPEGSILRVDNDDSFSF